MPNVLRNERDPFTVCDEVEHRSFKQCSSNRISHCLLFVSLQNSQVADDAASLKLIITELENENKDLRSKLVDFDDNKAALGKHFEKYLELTIKQILVFFKPVLLLICHISITMFYF